MYGQMILWLLLMVDILLVVVLIDLIIESQVFQVQLLLLENPLEVIKPIIIFNLIFLATFGNVLVNCGRITKP